MSKRVFLIVFDSVGIGVAPDAADYGDAGAATLQHCAQACGGLRLPTLEAMGLANIPSLFDADQGPITGLAPSTTPNASWGAMRERSQGKDTITGHWEIAGLELNPGFHLFPQDVPAFPSELIQEFEQQTGRKTIGNKHASGTKIIAELGEQSMKEGSFICYTSADSVFQIACNIEVIPLNELYAACEIARKLCDSYRVGRVIARPFIGKPGQFTRTKDRVDYAYQTEEPTILEHLQTHAVPVYSVGKIEDIFANRGITEGWHTGGNPSSMERMRILMQELSHGFVFANFIDFDMLYGHRRDPGGYGKCLEETDQWLHQVLPLLQKNDVLILTADHGNDPIFKGNDHTREYVPLLVIEPGKPARELGIRDGFYDIAQSVTAAFELPPMKRGSSFL